MFYSVMQAYLYMRTSSKSKRQEILTTIKADEHLEIVKSGFKVKSSWDKKYKVTLMEILLARYSQNLIEGKVLLKTRSSKLKRFELEGFEELDSKLYLRALLVCRKKLKERKGKSKSIPFHSADLKD